jgi:phosphotransferase system  glucose/maltose/N-acetylglucosamine-specific IIC component
MIKSETLFKTKEDVKKKSNNIFRFPYFTFGTLFFAFLYLAVAYSLFASVYIFAVNGFISFTWIGILIGKVWITSWILFTIIILIKSFYEIFHIGIIRRNERREQFKKEIIKEIKNDRNYKKSTR